MMNSRRNFLAGGVLLGAAAVSKARPLSQNGYKIKLAGVAVKRALLAAAGKGGAA